MRVGISQSFVKWLHTKFEFKKEQVVFDMKEFKVALGLIDDLFKIYKDLS